MHHMWGREGRLRVNTWAGGSIALGSAGQEGQGVGCRQEHAWRQAVT